MLALVDRCCTELLDEQYATACRRLLADVAAADPGIFRRKGRVETAAAAICWIVGKANALFDPRSGLAVVDGRAMQVKDLAAHFGVAANGLSPRAGSFLRAMGIDALTHYLELDLGTPRYLTGSRRAQIVADRDRFRAMVG